MRYPIDEKLILAGCYRDKEDIIDAAQPFKLIHEEGAREAVLMLHGYAGYPGELCSVAKAVYSRGFDVYVPRLPGMGTSSSDFRNTSSADWIGASENALMVMIGRYGKVSVLGHSMGALIAILLSLRHELKCIELVAPALKLRQRPSSVALKTLCALDKVLDVEWHSDPDYHLHYDGAPKDDLELGVQYWSHFYPRQFSSFLDMEREARNRIPDLDCPTLAIMGKDDPLVPVDVLGYFDRKRLSFTKKVVVPGGTHMLFYDKDEKAEEITIKECVDFLCLLS